MEKTAEFTGKTIEDAISAALAALKLERDDISVAVVEKPKVGFLGISRSLARISVTYEAPDEPAPAVKPSAPAAKPEPASKSEPATKPALKKAVPAQTVPNVGSSEGDAVSDRVKTERAKAFLEGLLAHLDITAKIDAKQTPEGNISVDISGDNMGILIGRRGDMLDAVQHLTGYAVNRGEQNFVRVTVDTENYRQKREEALVHLAQKTAAKVLKYRRNISLEPMNSYSRHAIHAALQDTPGITTFSTGSEPNRRIVVALASGRTNNRPQRKPEQK